MNKIDCMTSLITLVMTRLSLSIQLVLESSLDEEDDDFFFLVVTYVAMNTDEYNDEEKYHGSIKGNEFFGEIE
jgi:hypothetical protein